MAERPKNSTGTRPQAETIHGVRMIRDRPFHEVEADRLHKEFVGGDALALFRCLSLWEEEGTPFSSLPKWASEAWGQIGATYYREQVDWIENEAREWAENEDAKAEYEKAKTAGEKPSWKDLNEKKPKRKKRPPSFEKIAGISRGQGKPNAWKFGKDDTMQAYFDAIVAKAKCDPGLKHASPLNRRLTSKGRFVRFLTLSRKSVRVLNDRGQPTEAFKHAVMEVFGFGSGKGENKKSGARTFRRHRRDSGADK